MEYAFHVYNKFASDGMTIALDQLLRYHTERMQNLRKNNSKKSQTEWAGTRSPSQNDPSISLFNQPPVIVCIGSDLAIGDSLGPITGSMLKYKTQGLKTFIYGTLAAPITAKEIKYLRAFLKDTHGGAPIIAVDAAVGAEGDIGLIKLSSSPLYPGAGANKKLGAIGDISILGIVAEKSVANYGLLNTTRLNLVYSMSELLSDALASILYERKKTPTFESVQ